MSNTMSTMNAMSTTNITKFIEEMNKTNSINDKITTLTAYKSDILVQKVLKMTYDKVTFTYGITMKNIPVYNSQGSSGTQDLEWALNALVSLADRTYTGKKAIDYLYNILSLLSKDDAEIIKRVIDRDLKIGLGRTNINKVIKGLIVKPPYSRCDIGTYTNIKKNIDFKKRVFSQVKMDGTYRSCINDGGTSTIISRTGNEDKFPIIEEQLKTIDVQGYTLLGEMTLRGEQERSKSNGIINSITEREQKQDQIIFTVWDMLPNSEYSMSKDEIKKATKAGTLSRYGDRLDKLKEIMKNTPLDNVKLIEYIEVSSIKEVYEHFQAVTQKGDEGTVIKTEDMVWKDGTSKQQLKVKLVIDLDMRFTSYNPGNKGSKNEKYFSGINYENDEGTIKGTIGVTSMTEEQRDYFHTHRDEIEGSVFTLTCNDITKGKNNDYYACSHPRYTKIRTDKDTTDTLERALEIKSMAMGLGL